MFFQYFLTKNISKVTDHLNKHIERTSSTKSRHVNTPSQDEAQLLAVTLKNGDFFQTDYNALTMRFTPDEERKYQTYLMDLRVANSMQPIDKINDKNFGKLLWTHPQNLMFIGIYFDLFI